MKGSNYGLFVVLTVLVGLIFTQCEQIDFEEGENISFNLSQDSLTFDTVFTTIGSATKFIKIYNGHDKFITIDRIAFARENTFFTINVNGVSGKVIEKIEIAPEDSIYVFIEALIDPDQDESNSPFIIEEELEIKAGANTKTLAVSAWGQNAFYFPGKFNKGNIFILSCQDVDAFGLDNSKPWIFHGITVFDSCTLVVPEGTRIHIHGGFTGAGTTDGRIFFTESSNLIIDGTEENPVEIRGTRLEDKFRFQPGQYNGINFLPRSTGNVIRYANIQEGQYAVFLDSASEAIVENCKIRATSGPGIITRHANVDITNTLIEGNGTAELQMIYGGKASLRYCTFSNFVANQQYALFAQDFQDFDDDGDGFADRREFNDLEIDIQNSILLADEHIAVNILIDEENSNSIYEFKNCILNMSDQGLADNPDFINHLTDCILNPDENELFVGPRRENNYHLDSLSVATGRAMPLPGIEIDIENFPRNPTKPDIGAYESRFK